MSSEQPEERRTLSALVFQTIKALLQSCAQCIDLTSKSSRLRAYGRRLSSRARRHLRTHLGQCRTEEVSLLWAQSQKGSAEGEGEGYLRCRDLCT